MAMLFDKSRQITFLFFGFSPSNQSRLGFLSPRVIGDGDAAEILDWFAP